MISYLLTSIWFKPINPVYINDLVPKKGCEAHRSIQEPGVEAAAAFLVCPMG